MIEDFGTMWKRKIGIPVHALFDANGRPRPEAKAKIERADEIAFFDVMTMKQFLVYGLDRVKEVMRTKRSSGPLNCLLFSLDKDSEELEMLLTLVREVKGKDDYEEARRPLDYLSYQ